MYVDVGSGRESSRLVPVRLVFEATRVRFTSKTGDTIVQKMTERGSNESASF
jgi:hypothetical protein